MTWAEHVRFWVGLYTIDGSEVDQPGYARQLVTDWAQNQGVLHATVSFGPAGRYGWGPLDGVLLVADEGQIVARRPFPVLDHARMVRTGQQLELRVQLTLSAAPVLAS